MRPTPNCNAEDFGWSIRRIDLEGPIWCRTKRLLSAQQRGSANTVSLTGSFAIPTCSLQ